MVLKETMLYTCPRENFPRITTMNHAHLELEMCKIQEITPTLTPSAMGRTGDKEGSGAAGAEMGAACGRELGPTLGNLPPSPPPRPYPTPLTRARPFPGSGSRFPTAWAARKISGAPARAFAAPASPALPAEVRHTSERGKIDLV